MTITWGFNNPPTDHQPTGVFHVSTAQKKGKPTWMPRRSCDSLLRSELSDRPGTGGGNFMETWRMLNMFMKQPLAQIIVDDEWILGQVVSNKAAQDVSFISHSATKFLRVKLQQQSEDKKLPTIGTAEPVMSFHLNFRWLQGRAADCNGYEWIIYGFGSKLWYQWPTDMISRKTIHFGGW